MNYCKIYSSIIEKARQEKREKKQGTYYEAHHIEPRCLGGTGERWEWRFHPNIVLLTAKEHFVCHRLLTEMHPESAELAYAFWAMCRKGSGTQKRYIPSGRTYQEAKDKVKTVWSNRKGPLNPMYGRKHTQETKSKQSQAHKGKPKSQEHRANLSKTLKGKEPWNKGKTHSAESREKIRLAKLKKKLET